MDEITIKKVDSYYQVIQGNKSSLELGYDEMIGLVIALTMPEVRPCLQWMKTDEQHEHTKKYYESLKIK